MKKIITFLITFILLIIITPTVNAKTSFYEGEYIQNIWMNKKNPSNGLIYYNQARVFRETATNNIAYCIEPFVFFNSETSYDDTNIPENYTEEQILTMSLIAYFGYGYDNHTTLNWYAATQFLLWQVAEPTGYYYFSSYKNGPAVNILQAELIEIKNLVESYKKDTSFNNNYYTISLGSYLEIFDENQVLNSFSSSAPYTTITDNILTVTPQKSGTYIISLEKTANTYSHPVLFYQSKTSQDIIDLGNHHPIKNQITVKAIETKVDLIKTSSEKLEFTGDATLIDTKIALFFEDGTYYDTITMDSYLKTTISNLPFGTYYFQEIEPGLGYHLDSTKYYFTLDENTPVQTVTIKNQPIKANLIIQKEYGYDNHFQKEANISFNIYHNDKLLQTITTNSEGIASITLPYGNYTITQLTTTEGYEKIEPITFQILSDETITYTLKDYKIPVPNTHTASLFTKLITCIRKILICLKNYFH